MNTPFSRREVLNLSMAAIGLAAVHSWSAEAAEKPARSPQEPFGYCFNTSTIRGQNVGLVKAIEIAGAAGYHGIEPWIREIEEYVKSGGTLPDLKKRIEDAGLTVESAIGFAEWIVDDDERRAKGLEVARRDMDLLAAIGGKRIAAPPAGATKQADLDLKAAGQRFRKLCELGVQSGVLPELEVWGFSACLSRLSETMYVAYEAGHPQALILPDVYHLYRGGTSFDSLRLLAGGCVEVFHVNDYPAGPDHLQFTDAMRVYPGDGVAPLSMIFRTLYTNGFRGMLSLELFNPEYWKQDPLEVAKTGLQKTRAAVRAAFEGK